MLLHYYRKESDILETCFNVETSAELTFEEDWVLYWLLRETFAPQNFGRTSFLAKKFSVVEIGPRLNFATDWNTNAVAIGRACGINKIIRLEKSRRIKLLPTQKIEDLYDKMTECVYQEPLKSFEVKIEPKPVKLIPLKEEGPDALLKIPGISMDKSDRQMYYDYFVTQCHRNPTDVEIMDLNNANSEHSRHGYFKAKQIIDGQIMPETLIEIIKSTLKANPNNSLISFKDNSSVINGYKIITIVPQEPGKISKFVKTSLLYHFLFTAETHNFPSGIAPFPGAETGTGGRIRDVEATGRGGLVIAGTAGYCVGNLLIPNYDLPWENKNLVYPTNLASPLEILIQASNGASDYGNKFGEPIINGFTRSGSVFLNKERREWLKPIMFTGGIGQINNDLINKKPAKRGLLILQIGGPAYRIGLGGGAASSMFQGENEEELDFNAVQRGDAEMEQKMNRVIRACIEMGANNPIISIHDQGAGGPANVLKELVEQSGGRINIRKIQLGDPTLSVLEIWVAEYQERNGLLLYPERLKEFQQICKREQVNCELLGVVTDDGHFTVYDEQDDSTPVNLELKKVLGNVPTKTFIDETVSYQLTPLVLPEKTSLLDVLTRVLKLSSVGSKRFLTNKVDRSVTGLITQQQCCGPLQLPVADFGMIAQSHFTNKSDTYTGGAISIGEQPIKMLVNPEAGARMSVAEALTNIGFANISSLKDIKCSGNWMWPAKFPGEGKKIYTAAKAIRDIMIELGIAIDGGKDSLSMATKVKIDEKTTEIVKSPGQLVVSAYCSVPDITKAITPDFKRPGESRLLRIDLARRRRRLGGSALAQVFSQLGDESPDIEEPELIVKAFEAIKQLIDSGLVLAAHDISDGGFITSVLEMAFAGNGGFKLHLDCVDDEINNELFAEEAGWVIEYDAVDFPKITEILNDLIIPHYVVGETTLSEDIVIRAKGNDFYDSDFYFEESMLTLRDIWEETSFQLEKQQCDVDLAKEEKRNNYDRSSPEYYLSFAPQPTQPWLLTKESKPKVAIIREEGSNGDREMTSVFFQVGFDCFDITMYDLLNGKISLDKFKGVVFVGGFSYADTLDAAKGWAGKILFHERLRQMFDDFYNRSDTFSLGVCNGCQLMALLGWVPWQGIDLKLQPRFIKNNSGRFESRFVTAKILPSPAIMLQEMEQSILGIWVAHGEGKLHIPDHQMMKKIAAKNLAPIRYANDEGAATESYPFNPNGSLLGVAALCDPTGHHLAMMPHPERTFLKWQWGFMPQSWKEQLFTSPWLKMFQNARLWCDQVN